MSARGLTLGIGRTLGLFRLARQLHGGGLRILCYHGVAMEDEHTFLPKMFVSSRTLESRLAFLTRHEFPVLPLAEAVNRLRDGTLPAGATVVTFDDALYSTYRHAWPLLQRFAIPATLYVTSYYVAKGTPVFGLLVEYMFWKTTRPTLDVSGLGLPLAGMVVLTDSIVRARAMEAIVEHGESRCSEAQRVALARALAQRLDIDYDGLTRERRFSLMSPEEIRELAARGLDVQAHTHRHRFPDDEATVQRELADNRALLEPLTGKRLEHFCYPSGSWSERHWPWLTAAGFKTATTCEPGFNYPETPLLALKRFLDGEHISEREFEAEMFGYKELFRRARSRLQQVTQRRPIAATRPGQAWTSG
jgi:peptidoglycan/xylan/chitin deacetylase (PgdA/CDA1 family)